jgi:hypothetical protein
MVPSSRNPVWGEGFNFLAAELPAEVWTEQCAVHFTLFFPDVSLSN